MIFIHNAILPDNFSVVNSQNFNENLIQNYNKNGADSEIIKELYSEIEYLNNQLQDFFGNTVNTAARLEGKVSYEGGFAFAHLGKLPDRKNVEKLINGLYIDIVEYNDTDVLEYTRSGRLLTREHHYKCLPLEELNGVEKVIVYNCKIV